MLNINAKAVRDIWNRRTWTEETQHLWEDGEVPVMRSLRRLLKFKRSDSASSSSSASIEESEAENDSNCDWSRVCSSSLPSTNHSSHVMNQQLLTHAGIAVDATRGWWLRDEWSWECGVAPLGCGGEDPFADVC
mmetsp:Transcript_85889/g.229109  ORF Transcript_85889/g.229109 Transcript_85889/m.229109 type:complete len:134 (+) Transcript_85889:3-404(+)